MAHKTPPEELWNLYNPEGVLIRTIHKGELSIRDSGLYHETVEIIPCDAQGHLLVTRRAFEKRLGGGLFEFPSGSVFASETPVAAARRELVEETGLKASAMKKITESFVPGIKRYIYLASIPELPNTPIRLQPGETIDSLVIDKDLWFQMIADGRFDSRHTEFYNKKVYRIMDSLPVPPKRKLKKRVRALRPTTLTGSRNGVITSTLAEREVTNAEIGYVSPIEHQPDWEGEKKEGL